MSANRDIRKLQADILVVGGGTAGIIAAITAAEEGARVILLDQDSATGGVGTRGGVHIYWYGSPGGKQNEIDSASHRTATVFGGKPRGFHPEAKRSVVSEMLLEHSVNVVFNAMVYDVQKVGNRITGVLAATPDGTLEASARVIIDATGDGDVAAKAGVQFSKGRDVDGALQGVSVIPRRVEEDEKLNFLNFDAGWIDPQDPWDLSDGYIKARALLWDLVNEDPHLLSISPQIGLRESRQINGEYTLTWDDITHNRPFQDIVSTCFSHYDNHAYDFAHESDDGQIWTVILGLFFEGLWCRIPYRCLLPQGVDGLLVACRAISLSRDAHMLVRMQREMQKIGEVAAVAAAQSIRDGREPRDIDIEALQQRLLARGVIQPEDLDPLPHPSLHFTSGPFSRQKFDKATASQNIPELIRYLGTKEEGVALWWLLEVGEPAKDSLISAMRESENQSVRRAAAFGLALMGNQEAIPQLIETFVTRDTEHPEKGPYKWKSYPRWVAALTLLRMLGETKVVEEVLNALNEDHPTQNSTFLLQYLYHIAPKLNRQQREDVARRLALWSTKPGLGEDFKMSGGKQVSLRWAIDMRIALTLARCGDGKGKDILTPYLNADQAYLRRAATQTLALIDSEAFTS